MNYEELNFEDKGEVNRLLQSFNRDDRCGAIVGMINGIHDEEWVIEKLQIALFDEDFWVAKTAISGFGDLACIYGNLSAENVDKIFKAINRHELKGVMEDCLEDIRIISSK